MEQVKIKKARIFPSGEQFFPITHTKAVVDDYGNSVESILQSQTDIINAKQFEQGDVEWDIYPSAGSYGKVASSGGIKDALDNKVDTQSIMQSHSWDLSYGGDFAWIIGTIHADGTAHSSSSYYHINIPVKVGLRVKLKANSNYETTYAFLKDTDFTYNNGGNTITEHYASGYEEAYIIAVNNEKIFTVPEGCNYLYISVGQTSGVVYTPAENYYYTPKWDEDINALSEKIIPKVPLSATFTNGKGVAYDTGNLVNNAALAYSGYIDVHAYDVVNIGVLEASATSGYALYDENKQYISGGHGSGKSWKYTYTDIDTSEAYYLRLTSVASTDSHFAEMGYPQVIVEDKAIGESRIVNNLDITDAGYVLDARQGGLLKDMIINGINLSAVITSPYNGWWSYNTATLNADAQYGTNSTFLQTDKDIYIKADNGYQLSAIYLSGGKACGVDANGNMLSSGVVAYYDSIIVKAGHQWNVQARTSPISNIADLADFFSHFKVSYSEESLGEEMKEANPYFQTFASNGSLTKETIFSTSVDNGGGNTRRIPSVVVTNAKTLIAATEVRSSYADNAQTGIILARKTSDANSWTYNFVLPYNAESYGKVMNPCFVVDRSGAHGTTGRIYLFFIAFQITSNNNGWAYLCTSSEIDNMYVYSDDDGVTWSSPVSTKSAWETDSYNWMGVSPANGALMSDGTFVLPCMGYKGNWYAGIMYKTPSGSWTYSNKTSAAGDNESTVFVYDEKAYLNCRNETNGHIRTLYKLDMTTNEMVKVDYNYDPNLICQQSICNGTIGGNSTFFQTSNDPLTYNTRNRLTVWASKDGMKWARLIRVNDSTTYGYSVADCYDGKLVMVYENSGSISFIDLSSMATTIGTVYSKVLGKPLEDRLHELIEKLLAG